MIGIFELSPGNNTLGADQGYLVIPEGEAFPLSETVEAIGMREFLEKVEAGNL